jgi:hypothetical protein
MGQTPGLSKGNSEMEEFARHTLIEGTVLGIVYLLTRMPDAWATFIIPILMLGGFFTGFLLGRKQL